MSLSSREWTSSSSRAVQPGPGEAGASGGHGIILCRRAGVLAGAQLGPERQGPRVSGMQRQHGRFCPTVHKHQALRICCTCNPRGHNALQWSSCSAAELDTQPGGREALCAAPQVCVPHLVLGVHEHSMTRASPPVLLSEEWTTDRALLLLTEICMPVG